jgi:hypothetical protein
MTRKMTFRSLRSSDSDPTYCTLDGEVRKPGTEPRKKRIQGEVKRHFPKTYLFIEGYELLVRPFWLDDTLPPNQVTN